MVVLVLVVFEFLVLLVVGGGGIGGLDGVVGGGRTSDGGYRALIGQHVNIGG